MQYFQNIFYFARCTKCKGLIWTKKYSCQLCIILATGCQNLGRLNEVLYPLNMHVQLPSMVKDVSMRQFIWVHKNMLSNIYAKADRYVLQSNFICLKPFLIHVWTYGDLNIPPLENFLPWSKRENPFSISSCMSLESPCLSITVSRNSLKSSCLKIDRQKTQASR